MFLLIGENREFTLKMTIGCGLAMFGFGKYSHCKLQQTQHAAAAGMQLPAQADLEQQQQLLSKYSAVPAVCTDVPITTAK